MSANVILVAEIFTTYSEMISKSSPLLLLELCNYCSEKAKSQNTMPLCCLFHFVCKIGCFLVAFMIKASL